MDRCQKQNDPAWDSKFSLAMALLGAINKNRRKPSGNLFTTSKQKQNIFFIKGNTKDANISDGQVILRTGGKNLRGDKSCLHAQKGPVLFYVWSLNPL